jgi:23S rRNA (cytosine1962-C5)-methyltransferase
MDRIYGQEIASASDYFSPYDFNGSRYPIPPGNSSSRGLLMTSLYPQVKVRPERRKSLLGRHPWLFSGALSDKPKVADGSLVSIVCGNDSLGVGYYNSRTDIAVRLLSPVEEKVDAVFFARRFRELQQERLEACPPDTTAWRVVFGEADGCPGLIVDRYADVLVMQLHTAGMDGLRKDIVAALVATHAPRAIVERSDLAVRRQEGLQEMPVGVVYGSLDGEVEFLENGHRFIADVLKGQKTGFFLDQRENRLALQRWCKGRSVLNVFSYTGGFSVYAAAAGARRVASLDASASAMALCRRNMALNGFDLPDPDYRTEDAFEALSTLEPGEFDCLIIDPPSLAKNRNQLKNAIKAYTSLNTKALKALPVGGILVSASCTTHIDPLTFIKILHQSALNANCGLKILETKEQPFDHPYNLAFPEGRYLKFFVTKKTAY